MRERKKLEYQILVAIEMGLKIIHDDLMEIKGLLKENIKTDAKGTSNVE